MLTYILIIIFFEYILTQILGYLNINNWSPKVPAILSDVYDEDKYRKANEYAIFNYRFSVLSSTFSIIILSVVLIFGGFGWLDNFVRSISGSEIIISLLFFGIIGFISDILSIPFSLYKIFVIEEKFGFNKMTLKTFFTDKLKGYLIAVVAGSIVISVIVKCYLAAGNDFWWITWMFFTSLMIFMLLFYTSLILPLFNKLLPLPAGDLRMAIENYSLKNNFPLNDIYVMDGSKRSSKSNAFFSGLGAKKKIVLFDTLIKNHTTDELVAVLAHETGHYKLKHTLTGLFTGIFQTGLLLFVFSLLQGNGSLSAALGSSQPSIHLELLAFSFLYSPVSMIGGIIANIISRKNEFEADAFAGKTFSAPPLIDALKKLSSDNLSNLTPHPLYVFFNYSHPPLIQRLSALLNLQN